MENTHDPRLTGDVHRHSALDVSPRRPCLDILRAQDAAYEIAASFEAAESAGWPIALACGGRCWVGMEPGTWEPVATTYQGGRAYRSEAMVIVDPASSGQAPVPVDRGRIESEVLPADGIALAAGIVDAFRSVSGMLVVALGPETSIIADPDVGCGAVRMDGRKMLLVDLRPDTRAVLWSSQSVAEMLVRNDRDPSCWKETILSAMELCLEAGHLARWRNFLTTDAAVEMLASADPVDMSRFAAICAGLADAELTEAAGGGRESLVNRDHPFSRWLAANKAMAERANRAQRSLRIKDVLERTPGPAT